MSALTHRHADHKNNRETPMNNSANHGAPVIAELQVIPVAGQDSMLLNLSGAHGPYFTRNIVILKDNAGNTGVGEVPGGENIRKTIDDARPLIVGRPIGRQLQQHLNADAQGVCRPRCRRPRPADLRPAAIRYVIYVSLGSVSSCCAWEETGLPVVTEVLDITTFDMVEESADLVQIGTRNMQNFSLLKRAGASKRPILLKRGMAATIEEWLMAAEYILAEGNSQVILCERGVRTFVNHSRNTLDLSAVPVVRNESHLPIIIDPSHAAGKRDQVIPLSRAAMAVEAHGLIVEVHHDPARAMSDGAQSLYPEQYELLCRQVNTIYENLK